MTNLPGHIVNMYAFGVIQTSLRTDKTHSYVSSSAINALFGLIKDTYLTIIKVILVFFFKLQMSALFKVLIFFILK